MTTHTRATATRPECVRCGAKYGQRNTHSHQLRWAKDEPAASYEGYLHIVRRGSVRQMVGTGENRQDVEVWDGKTWLTPYEPFCTLRCALSYARWAWSKR